MCNIVNLSVIQNNELDVHIARWWRGGARGGSEGKESAYSPGDRVQSLCQEDTLEKEMATHSNILAWRIP